MWSELPAAWIERLGDHIDLLVGFAFKSAQFTEDPSGVRLLRGDNVGQGRLRWDGARRWPHELQSEFERYEVHPGDIVLAMDRPWIEAGLKYGVACREDVPCLLVQRVARLRGRTTLSQRYLGYVIGSPEFTHYVRAMQTGTAVPHISGQQIADFRLRLPPRREQERVADLLGALDDKIDSNRRLIRLLGEVSSALFAHLDAPVAETLALGEVVDVIDCLHSKKPEQRSEGNLLLQLNNIRKDGLLDVDLHFLVSEADYANWTRRIELREGDCVITNVGRVGAVARIPDIKAALGRNMTGLRCRSDWPFPAVLIEAIMSSRTRQAIDELTDAGTVMDALNVRNIPRLPLPMLSRDSLEQAESRLSTMWRCREALLRESRTLGRLRDALLPKLISGQIRVSDTHDSEEVIGPAAEELAAATS